MEILDLFVRYGVLPPFIAALLCGFAAKHFASQKWGDESNEVSSLRLSIARTFGVAVLGLVVVGFIGSISSLTMGGDKKDGGNKECTKCAVTSNGSNKQDQPASAPGM